MKTIVTLFCALFLTLGANLDLKAQTPEATFQSISAAIQKGDAQVLSGFFSANVELALPGVDQTYSAQQAQFVLKDFFTKYPVSAYKQMHTGSSGATWYSHGTYSTAKETFDTNIFIKKFGEKFQVTTLRFENE